MTSVHFVHLQKMQVKLLQVKSLHSLLQTLTKLKSSSLMANASWQTQNMLVKTAYLVVD